MKTQGSVPSPRIGHSLIRIDRSYILFGGLESFSSEKIAASNSVFTMKLAKNNCNWTLNNCSGDIPLARCNHAATEIQDGQMLVFGGYFNSKRRFNDTYILKVLGNPGYVWRQPSNQQSGQPPQNTESKIGAPEPRANHSAIFVEDLNRVYIFGGHGGVGYSRKAFNDLHFIDTKNFEWTRVEALGSPPEPRGGHVAGLLPKSRRLFVQGGWSSISQYSNLYIFEVNSNTWSELNVNFHTPRWNHCGLMVPALPHWKLFFFGGSSAYFEEGAPRNFGEQVNSTAYLDIIEDLEASRLEHIRLESEDCEAMPSGRENSTMVYDSKEKRLLVFGGWSNTFNNDVFQLDIGKITGPDYAIYSIDPELGPLTGSTSCRVNGEGFRSAGNFYVRFQNQKAFRDVPATFESADVLVCKTPSFEDFGPKQVDVRVYCDHEDLTITLSRFQYFLNTKADKTIAFGPGLLLGNAVGQKTKFFIQARNLQNSNRASGNDTFKVGIYYKKKPESEDEEGTEREQNPSKPAGENTKETETDESEEVVIERKEIPYELIDKDDGQYVVEFTAEEEGEIELEIQLLDEKGEFQPIRGSPFQMSAVAATEETNNDMNGPLVAEYIEKRISFIDNLLDSTKKNIDTSGGMFEEDVFALLKIVETIQGFNEGKEPITLELEVIAQMLANLETEGLENRREQEKVKKLAKSLGQLQKETLEVQQHIVPNVKSEKAKCQKQIEAFEDRLKKFYFVELKGKPVYKYETGEERAFELIGEVQENVGLFQQQLKDFEYFSKMFKLPEKTSQSKKNLEMIRNETRLVSELWSHIKKTQSVFAGYRQLSWGNVNAQTMQEETKALGKKLTQMRGIDKKSDVFRGVMKDIKTWAQFLPIVEELRKDAMNVEDDRHWKKFKRIMDVEFDLNKDTPLETFWEFGITGADVREEVEEITEQAAQEKRIETDLEKVKEVWDDVLFLFQPLKLKDADLETLKMPDEFLEVLDEHQLLIQNIAGNKHMTYYEAKVLKWLKGLANVNETIRLLSEVQKTWSFLINLFVYSQEVKRELPDESEHFKKIHAEVQEILREGRATPNVFEFSNSAGELTILQRLENILDDLGKCQKGLNDFIASKRKVFPRFYFLTMEELLDILANGNNPKLLFEEKNYMNKVVQAGERLHFVDSGEERPAAASLKSSVGKEELIFTEKMVLRGKVEKYLGDLLKLMQDTLRTSAKSTIAGQKKSLSGEDRKNFIESNYAQLNLLADNVVWVSEVEQRFLDLQAGNADAIKSYYTTCKKEITELIRFVQGPLPKPLRKKFMSLITIDTHSRDVIAKLIGENVRKADEFQWQSQLKFYWDDEKQDCYVRIADAKMWYSYEYLGIRSCLVITKLTDRIYVTATQALHLKMGCAPAGPAGTGKTETTKDLSSAIGKACYVFNCSGEMNYVTMGNIFKGLAASGTWGCFDEFNRLIPEVLSVCTVQFKAVTDAIKMQKEKFVIEGETLTLNPTCGVFITMNPGYLGRAELPEGLKALFRPITVEVPDLEAICENILMAEGFVDAKVLALKFVTLYKLCGSLFSDQDHYDWGLRAIKSVLVVAGTFKRAEPEISEQKLLFRALRDFNYPKIAACDLGIFDGLLSDLFPGVDIPRKVDKNFEQIIIESAIEMNMTPDDEFILKVVQLGELMEIRHCIFVMGNPGAGKSSTWKVLARANEKSGRKTTIFDLDPKVVDTRNLYGYTNLTTKEWKNGLLSHYMQLISEELTDGDPKWIVLDGDLDANWIESMNSVMDDNRLLTLANNGRIILKDYTKLLFEIRDLKFATKATVTRAGILYISDDKGYQRKCYIASWLKLFAKENNVEPEPLALLFEKFIGPTVDFMRKSCKFVIPVTFISMIVAACKLLQSMMVSKMTELLLPKDPKDEEARLLPNRFDPLKLEYVFVMCTVWGFGGSLCEKDKQDYRKDFSSFWKSEFKGPAKFPSKGTIFDYFVKFEEGRVFFEDWKKVVQTIDYNPSVNMNSVTVPIPETVSVQTLSKHLIEVRHPVLFIGGSGSGKTQLVKGLLKDIRTQDPTRFYYLTINFNYYTDSEYLQTMMESELVKQGNRYGPKKGSKIRLIYFIDDLNMPKLDKHNTQTAIALLRQHMDYSHWYDITKQVPILKKVVNTQTVAAMNPTSGSFYVNPRYQRHFWTVSVNYPEANSQIMIYETFLKGHFKRFKSQVQDMSVGIIKAAINLHERVQATFRKTANNFHYEFTIRHLAGIFQGILQSSHTHHWDQEKVVKLWVHESERVYCDRLVCQDHINQYKQLSFECIKKSFSKFSLQKYFSGATPEALLFTNFPNGYQNERYYDVVPSEGCQSSIEEALRDYNEYNEMKLILFDDAVRHVCRISRILSNSSGHALLVGVGGSGKQSLTRLAAFMCDLTVFSITVSSSYGMNQLKEDLMDLCNKSGLKDEGMCFMINDTHITSEKFLVYINDLLSSGEVADLYNEDDKMNIINSIRPKAKAEGKPTDTPDEVWSFFIDKVKQNLHVTLCFSPVGDTFRTRARRFPGLVNCTVIDWFQPWPKEALRSVAEQFLEEVDLGSEEFRRAVVDFMPFSFEAVNKAAGRCLELENRFVYSTPKSFLELLSLFINMLNKKRETLEAEQDTYELGLFKLEETEEKVGELQKKIKVIQVNVEKNKKNADKVAQKVGKEKAKMEIESQKAQLEEEKCTQIKLNVEEQRTSCESEVKRLKPLVDDAKAKLSGLNIKHITFLRSLATPPKGIEEVFHCVMIMLSGVKGYDGDIETNKKGEPKNLTWKGCLRLMNKPQKLIALLGKFNEEINEGHVPPKNFEKIKVYYKTEEAFKDPQKMRNKSQAAGSILEFMSCMVQYYDAMTLMIPKRKALVKANQDLINANQRLGIVKAEVAQLEADLAVMVKEFDEATEAKNKAIAEADFYAKKLHLAQRLVKALGSEKSRWSESITMIKDKLDVIVGDVLLASAFISYTGPFTKKFRKEIMNEEFMTFFHKKGLPMSADSDPVSMLVDDATKAEWNNQGLPNDPVSIENGVILSASQRYPLMIDPQLQGLTWIKQKEKARGLISMRVGSKNYINTLERAIEHGTPVLLENLDENIDPILTPVIARMTSKKAGRKYLKFGGKELSFNEDFRLFMQTKLGNPHYPPEIQAETALINFTVTEEGLSDQLLALVVSKERPDLSEQKVELIQSQNQFKIKLKQLEKGLLEKLKESETDILENIELIDNLEQSQVLSMEIRDKVAIALETEKMINEASEFFRPVAVRGALIFFVMNEIYKMSSFYMYSLESFLEVIIRALLLVPVETPEKKEIEPSSGNELSSSRELSESEETPGEEKEVVLNPIEEEEKRKKLIERVCKLTDSVTLCSFLYVRRGLFEDHKVIFATMLCLKILQKTGQLKEEEVQHLVQGRILNNAPSRPEKVKKYLTEQIWKDCKALEYVEDFNDLCEKLEADHLHWRKWYAEEKVEEIDLPKKFKNASEFHKLLLIKAMRPDRVSSALKMFVCKNMSKEFIEQEPFNMEEVYGETNSSTPIFFVLFPGVDPTPETEAIGRERGKIISEGTFINISMGQGQEDRALRLLEEAAEKGDWIFLQNVHLMETWLKIFERKLEEVSLNPHPDFRCFISSEPPSSKNPTKKIIPEAILQRCIKVSNEAPQDLKANMRRALNHFSEEHITQSSKKSEFKSILFGLCYFHSMVLGRKKFGRQGWSATYNFNDGDLTICADVLHNYLEKYEQVPYDDLRYIYGEIMYGGRITDPWDRRINNTYLKVLITPQLTQMKNLVPGSNPIYRVPDPNKNQFADYVKYIDKLPNESPLMFGMHSNAEINYLTNQCEYIFRTIVNIQGGGGGSSEGKDESVLDLVLKYMDLIPKQFDLIKIQEMTDTNHGDTPSPYDIVCVQECQRMNQLLYEILFSLEDLKLGLGGSLNMTEGMEALAGSLKLDRVPASWGVFYASKKPLSSWFDELKQRSSQLVEWSSELRLPRSICLSFFFNPMSFLTAIMQHTARKQGLALDSMVLDTEVTHFQDPSEILIDPEEGVYIHGLFLEGASWELGESDGYLIEQKLKELHPPLPVIHVIAIPVEQLTLKDKYNCPVYYTTARGPTYVFTAHFKMESDESEDSKWVLAGVAAILNDDF